MKRPSCGDFLLLVLTAFAAGFWITICVGWITDVFKFVR